jgi:hypothetical protein
VLIKYVGPVRPGVETPEGVLFEYDKPVEVPDDQAKALIKTGDFKPARPKKGEVSE